MARRIILNEVPDERPVAEILAEIRALYFKTTAKTIERDFDRAIDLLKSIPPARRPPAGDGLHGGPRRDEKGLEAEEAPYLRPWR